MNKILICFFVGMMVTLSLRADEPDVTSAPESKPSVIERTNCAAVAARILELENLSSMSVAQQEELTELTAKQRRDCSKSVAGRRTSGRQNNIVPQLDDVAPAADTENDVADTAILEPTSEVEVFVPDVEQITAWIEQGLCADGTKPNKYGCCGEEIFKDLGEMNFACCLPNGGDCFPPIK